MKSKQWWFFVIFLALLVVGAANMFVSSHQKNKEAIKTSSKGIAVVELFTSEGCSSCPPADELLGKLKDEANPNVILLAFHVDYWNYLGWKDRFSKSEYSQRQQKYSELLKCSTYTPMMIVNGATQFVGSDEKATRNAINESLSSSALVSVSVQPKYNTADRSVTVVYKVDGKIDNEILNVALIQKTAQSKVLKGENAGKHLSHVNVVRDFQTVVLTTAEGTVKLILPQDISTDDVQVVAYTQHASDLKVTGAVLASLNSN